MTTPIPIVRPPRTSDLSRRSSPGIGDSELSAEGGEPGRVSYGDSDECSPLMASFLHEGFSFARQPRRAVSNACPRYSQLSESRRFTAVPAQQATPGDHDELSKWAVRCSQVSSQLQAATKERTDISCHHRASRTTMPRYPGLHTRTASDLIIDGAMPGCFLPLPLLSSRTS